MLCAVTHHDVNLVLGNCRVKYYFNFGHLYSAKWGQGGYDLFPPRLHESGAIPITGPSCEWQGEANSCGNYSILPYILLFAILIYLGDRDYRFCGLYSSGRPCMLDYIGKNVPLLRCSGRFLWTPSHTRIPQWPYKTRFKMKWYFLNGVINKKSQLYNHPLSFNLRRLLTLKEFTIFLIVIL